MLLTSDQIKIEALSLPAADRGGGIRIAACSHKEVSVRAHLSHGRRSLILAVMHRHRKPAYGQQRIP